MLDAITKRSRAVRAYRAIFLDEHGQLKADAEIVLDDLYQFARFFKSVPLEPQALAAVEGSRQVVRHILKRLKVNDTKRQTKGDIYDE